MASGRTDAEREGVCVFLLMVLAVHQHTVKAEVKILDMALDAVDDDFSECREKMLQVIIDSLLQKELSADNKFEKLWSKHNKTCHKSFPGGTPYHITALQAYGNSAVTFRRKFNNLVLSKGNNSTTYREEFPFKSLHFLLTDSLRLLKPANICTTVYSTTSNKYMADVGAEVRFGKFHKAEVSQSSAVENVDKEDEATLFVINSCSVVKVDNYTCKCEELQCLVSPAEVFRVLGVKKAKVDNKNFKQITLKHSRFLSNQHCSFFHRNSAGVKLSVSLTLTLLILTASMLSVFTVMA